MKCSLNGKHSQCPNRKLIRLEAVELDFFSNFLFKNPYELINGWEKEELTALNKEIAIRQARVNAIDKETDKICKHYWQLFLWMKA